MRSSALVLASGRIVSTTCDQLLPSLISCEVDIDDPTPPESLPCSVRTFVRPLDRFPPNFESRASKNGKGVISPMPNERALLASLLGRHPLLH